VSEPAADVPLAPLTTLRLGGPARRLVTAASEDELVGTVRQADADGEPLLVLAGGSNLVIADEGWGGTVVRVATRGVELRDRADGRITVHVAAGEDWDELVGRLVAESLVGAECLAGIPGSAGATPIQNVGAYGQEVGSSLASVRVLDRTTGAVAELAPAECGLGYRTSIFKRSDRHVVLGVSFTMPRSRLSAPIRYAELARTLGVELDARVPLPDARAAVLELRRAKGMVLDPDDHDTWSAGSFFTNPVLTEAAFAALGAPGETPPRFPAPDGQVKTSAAWLIERAGFHRGEARGGIALSGKHVLALTNRGGGTTSELVGFAREIADAVQERFGVALAPEPVFAGVTWEEAGGRAAR
jgi:UDP-N-acetylmuramate dehydrogenase